MHAMCRAAASSGSSFPRTGARALCKILFKGFDFVAKKCCLENEEDQASENFGVRKPNKWPSDTAWPLMCTISSVCFAYLLTLLLHHVKMI